MQYIDRERGVSAASPARSTDRPRVVVVGAGIAGLVAAYTLQQHNLDVVVLEASSRVGGRMVSDVTDDYVIDSGTQFLSHEYKLLASLAHELGLGQDMVQISPAGAILRDGHFRRLDVDRPWTWPFSGLLTWSEWLRFAWGSGLLFRTRNLSLNDYSQWHFLDDEVAEGWGQRCVGKGAMEHFVEPVIGGFFFQRPDEMSKAMCALMMSHFARNRTSWSLRGGMGSLPIALASRLNVMLGAKVRELEITGSGVRVSTDEQVFAADQVILATTASVARRLYSQADAQERILMDTGYSPTVHIAIATDGRCLGPHLSGLWCLLIPRAERGAVVCVGIESGKGAGRMRSGELLSVMTSGDAARDIIEKSDTEIVARVLPDLERYFPGLTTSIRFSRVTRWREAQPLSPVGRSRNLLAYRNTDHRSRRVMLAGDYMGVPGAESAAETGVWAAAQTVARFAGGVA